MTGLLQWAARYGTVILPLGIFVGLTVQPLAALTRPLLMPAAFLMLAVLFMRLDVLAAVERLRRPELLVLSVVLSIMVVPLLTAAVLALFPQSPGLNAALILYTSSPPNFVAAALAFLLGLNGALAVALILAALALHPIVTPVILELVTGGAILISGGEMALRLAVFIGGAVMVAAFGRRLLGEARRRRAGVALDGLNVVLMLVFVIALMDGVPGQIAARPAYAAVLMTIAFGLHLGLNAVTTLIFWRAGTATAATVGFCSGGRNMAPAMAVLGAAAPTETWLFFAILQFPLYILPMLLKPIYRRLLNAAPLGLSDGG